MRIRSLEIAGFGPYKDRQVVDFDDFADAGLFLITGKTGAGKSSILDAICFALYGTIPRFENTQQRLRSDHCEAHDPTSVVLVFTIDGTDYRVTRSPEYDRPKRGRVGTTTQKPTASLERRDGDEWIGVAARPVDVGTEIALIVALTKEQFLQVILLAQNRFQDFLLAKNDDRQQVLRSLFRTGRFLGVEVALVERRKRLEGRIGDARDALAHEAARAATLLELEETPVEVTSSWFIDALGALTTDRDAAQSRTAAAATALASTERQLRALEEIAGLQSRRSAAVAELAGLAARGATRGSDRDRVSAARLAAVVWPYVEAVEHAQTALVSAGVDVDATLGSYHEHLLGPQSGARQPPSQGTATPTSGDLAAIIDGATRLLGNLESALAAEQALPALVGEISGLEDRVTELASRMTSLRRAVGELPARIGGLATDLAAAQTAAATAAEAARRVTRLEGEADAVAEGVALAPQVDASRLAEVAASATHSAATRAIEVLLEQRLAGHAGELATALRDGDACGVCGATVHPRPATIDAALVTDAHVDAARVQSEVARGRADDASRRRRDLEASLASAAARGHGASVEDLEEQLLDARRLLTAATAAATRVVSVAGELDASRTELTGAEEASAVAHQAHTAAAGELLQAMTRRAAITERVDESRGDFGSIEERVDELRRRVMVAQGLAAAVGALEARTASAMKARAVLATHLAERGLADADAVTSSRLDATAIASLEHALRQADDLAAAAAATIAEAAVASAPAEPVDLSGATAAVTSARELRDTALGEHRSLTGRVDQLTRVVESAARRGTACASLREEFRQLRELSNAVEGNEPNDKRMRLETYVLAARLEQIVDAANVRLRTMTGGRYTLEHDDALQFRRLKSGLGLAIRDEHSGRARATHSLSGGETFLASLALALGLAEVVTSQSGGVRLDTLFIDEGFGSLDADTLGIAMGTLDSLRSGGRTIGLISHVDAMKEQIPAKLRITVGDRGYSTIEGSYEVA